MTDRVQLQQVLLNLIVNACDAIESNPPKDRILTLTTLSGGEDEIRIGVLDHGIGLPDDVETLFQPFHSTKHGGLGIGASICRTLMTSHRGRLWAEPRAVAAPHLSRAACGQAGRMIQRGAGTFTRMTPSHAEMPSVRRYRLINRSRQ